ncbi:ferroxidase fet3 [Basidiobolus ranarum]|uniref:Ferroxidase fet3 n=1 Tax=Basidiobolus ranarum TaxID=34480 RepID=A0ABR2W8P3_9FUNG
MITESLKKLLLSGLVLGAYVHAADKVYNWNITYVDNVDPTGGHPRRAIGVNGQFPVPHLEATIGDDLVINVHNSLDVGTTLHAHGVLQNGTTYYDGAAMFQQCPIPPGGNYTYRIPIQQHGTYWIHSHFRGQYVDGLRAPIVLHAQKEQYTYDAEYIVALSDWYYEQHDVLLSKYLSIYNPSGAEPVPDAGEINGSQNATFNFVAGKVYRLRIINMSAFSMFNFHIDGHDLEIIEADGVDLNSKTVQTLPITAAQRYSVLVRAKNSTANNFIMHADVDVSMFPAVNPNLNPNINATIIYDPKAALYIPSDSAQPDMQFDDTSLVPITAATSAPPDNRIEINVFFNVLDNGVNRGMFNNVTYLFPSVPSIFTAYSMGAMASDPRVYGKHTNTYVIEHNQMIELVINNWDADAHPFHLHGHQFQVMSRSAENGGGYDSVKNPVKEQANPIRRDTVQVPAQGHVVIRFRADNPGIWPFHCHIEWHLESGLVATIVEAPLQLQASMKIPQQSIDHCVAQGIKTSGNAVGNEGLDFSGYPTGPNPLPGKFTAKGIWALVGCILSAIIGISTLVWFSKEDPSVEQKCQESDL